MGKNAFFVVLVLLLAAPGVRAITTYDIQLNGNDAVVNVTFELYTSAPGEKVNYWTTAFSTPPHATILHVSDSKGVIGNYTVSNGKISLETNKGGLKEREVVTLIYRLQNIVNQEYAPLRKLNLSLAAFGDVRPDVPDEQTFVTIRTEEPIISFTASLGFVSRLRQEELTLAGNGPVSFVVFFGNGGHAYQHYIMFGDDDLTAVDKAYGVVPAVTGLAAEFEKIPVVPLPASLYEKEINSWSAGEYRNGMIVVKTSAVGDDSFTATMLHETAHALNERALRWSKADVSWFDEGIAKYVEFLVNKNANVKQAEIFGSPVKWLKGTTVYTLPSRSSAQELWDYYQSGQTFMETWNPDSASTREFGYAFSELVVRELIMRKGPNALHNVLQQLLHIRKEVDNPEEYNSILLNLIGSDFRPCYSTSRSTFDDCLKRANKMTAHIPVNVTIEGVTYNISIPEIATPSEEPVHSSIIQNVIDFFQSLIDAIVSMFG